MKIPFFSHAGTKVMAVALAVLLWGFAYLQNIQDETVECLVSFFPSEELTVTVEPERKELVLEVRGPRNLVEKLSAEGTIYIEKKITLSDLDGLGDADVIKYPVYITVDDMNADPAITFANLPRRIDLTIMRMGSVRLPVELNYVGNPALGWRVEKSENYTWPSTVTVSGPVSVLAKAKAKGKSIRTWEFDITGRKSWPPRDLDLETKIDGERVIVTPSSVTVHIAIRPDETERIFEGVPIQFLTPKGYPYKLSLDTDTVSVTVKGPQTTITRLEKKDIKVFVVVDENMTPTELAYTSRLDVSLPEPKLLEATLSQANVGVNVTAIEP